jgi:hypothetical protein
MKTLFSVVCLAVLVGAAPVHAQAIRGLVDINPDGSPASGGGASPSGMIAFFAGACPSGWTEYTAMQGRMLVGLVSGGTAEGTVGTALTNLQDKSLSLTHAGTTVDDHASHTHTYTDVIAHTHTQDAHTHTQNSHNHTQDAHSHTQASTTISTGGASNRLGTNDTSSTAQDTGSTVATNQAATATNQNATATNQATGIATGTTAGPSATLTHGVTQPNAHSVNTSDTIAYIQLRACAAP